MTRAEAVTRLQNLLRRKDCTTDTATVFLGQGLSRIQRLLRVPSMERATWTNATGPLQSVEIATDTLQLIDVLANGIPLEKLAYRQLLTQAARATGTTAIWPVGQPESYARIGASLFLFPRLPAGGQLTITYYGTFTDLPTPESTNEALTGFPDLCVYAGLSFAGDFYRHDSANDWESRFQALLTETQDQANQLDATGGSEAVQSAYGET